MILHAVFCNVLARVSTSERAEVFERLSKLSMSLDGVLSFEAGPNRDFEGKSPNYSDGFVICFTIRGALTRYAEHPEHLALGAKLCTICEGGADGIIVFDLDV